MGLRFALMALTFGLLACDDAAPTADDMDPGGQGGAGGGVTDTGVDLDPPIDHGRPDVALVDQSQPDSMPVDGGLDARIEPMPPQDDLAARARAAVFIGSCIPDDGVQRWLTKANYERDINAANTLITAGLDCFSTADNGCAAVETCIGVSTDRGEPCQRGCNGNVAERCDDGLRFRWDCERIGQVCSGGRCVQAGMQCDNGTFVDRCENGRPTGCSRGRVQAGPACEPLGLQCSTSPGSAFCTGTEEPCTSTVGVGPYSIDLSPMTRCQDGIAEICVGQAIQRVDCQLLHAEFQCQSVGDSAFCGIGAQCDPRSANTRCDGNDLVVCNAGSEVRVACPELGFEGCRNGVCVPAQGP